MKCHAWKLKRMAINVPLLRMAKWSGLVLKPFKVQNNICNASYYFTTLSLSVNCSNCLLYFTLQWLCVKGTAED